MSLIWRHRYWRHWFLLSVALFHFISVFVSFVLSFSFLFSINIRWMHNGFRPFFWKHWTRRNFSDFDGTLIKMSLHKSDCGMIYKRSTFAIDGQWQMLRGKMLKKVCICCLFGNVAAIEVEIKRKIGPIELTKREKWTWRMTAS